MQVSRTRDLANESQTCMLNKLDQQEPAVLASI